MADDSAEGNAHLVSVASCGVDSGPNASTLHQPASLLFSLQFYVDRVALDPVPASSSPSSVLHLAFQLLQYEIVVFDTALALAEASAAAVTRVHHGKSCLFEADPDELVRDLQRDAETPLTLLLLAKEHGRARLRAFATVSLLLHVGLLDGDVLSSSRLLRICEWASHSGSWELRDHHNTLVGSVTGAVTLSCLGKSLAPHLTHALGVRVIKSQPSSPRVQVAEKETNVQSAIPEHTAEDEKPKDKQPTADVTTAVHEGKQTEMQDSSVQCDEDMLVEDGAESALDSRNWEAGIHQDRESGTEKATGSTVEEYVTYYKSCGERKGASSRRRTTQRQRLKSHQADRNAVSEGDLLFPRELPPPLFFQKGSRKANSKN